MLIVIVLAIGAFVMRVETRGVFRYSVPVDDLPKAHAGRLVRVHGTLRQGSLLFRDNPCEWRFILDGQKRSLSVRHASCIVPDTFRDTFPIDVTVQGRMQDWGFEADQVVVHCPSKYEMEMCEEDPPHALP